MASQPPAPRGPGYDQEVESRAERQRVVTPSGEIAGRDVAATEAVDNVEARRSTANWITGLVYFLFGLIEIAIALRILLKLLAADPNAGFSQLIYGVTRPFIAPFAGILGQPA